MKKIFLITPFLFLILLSGCIYRTPTDDDICVVPNVNNPSCTRERAPSLHPGI